jgi:hypothetical protein
MIDPFPTTPRVAATLGLCVILAIAGPLTAWRLRKLQRSDGWRYYAGRPVAIILGVIGTAMALLLVFSVMTLATATHF